MELRRRTSYADAARERWPRVYWFYHLINKLCLLALLIGLSSVTAIPLIGVFVFGTHDKILIQIAFGICGCCISLALFCPILQLIIIALFFCRYSVAEIFGAMLAFNALVAAIIGLPGMWKVIPGILIMYFSIYLALAIYNQRPEEGGAISPTVAAAERRRRLAAIRKKFGR